jgi:hypothetical protein
MYKTLLSWEGKGDVMKQIKIVTPLIPLNRRGITQKNTLLNLRGGWRTRYDV